MTREELREHCKKQIDMCEMWAKNKGEEPHGKVYEEHKLILELLEQESVTDFADRCKECGKTIKQKYTNEVLDKIREEIINPNEMDKLENSNLWQKWFLNLIDKYKAESEG